MKMLELFFKNQNLQQKQSQKYWQCIDYEQGEAIGQIEKIDLIINFMNKIHKFISNNLRLSQIKIISKYLQMAEFSTFFGTLAALETQNALRRSRVQAQLGTRGINEALRRSRNQPATSPLKHQNNIERQIVQAVYSRTGLEDSAKRADIRHTQNAIRRERLIADLAVARRQTQEQYRREQERGAIRKNQEVHEKILINRLKQDQYLMSEAIKNERAEANIDVQVYRNLIHRYV